jgi:3-isopropylmalate dehydratase small subunit
MGDQDIAAAWAFGKVWFKVPATVRLELEGLPDKGTTPKDVGLALLKHFGANGLLGVAAELYGEYVAGLDLAGRITLASLATEMGAIILMFPPDASVLKHCRKAAGMEDLKPVLADPKAEYAGRETITLSRLGPLISRPGHPEDVVPLAEVAGKKVDSVFIGSCTNGRLEDLEEAAKILKGKHVAPGVVLKVVPSTDSVWQKALQGGLIGVFKDAGALVSNAGCAGCAAGQVGQNGPGEVTISTGNRNFAGKQGRGEVYLASPAVAAASAIAGYITSPGANLPKRSGVEVADASTQKMPAFGKASRDSHPKEPRPLVVKGRVWVILKDNIDTDMIFHNRHLAITEVSEMGQHALGNLSGWEDFSKKARPGDIVVTGKNFGAGSSRQQAVDCFKALGIAAIVAKSYGAIYERNAINAAMPIVVSDLADCGIEDGEEVSIDFVKGKIRRHRDNSVVKTQPWPEVQVQTFQRGGLLG